MQPEISARKLLPPERANLTQYLVDQQARHVEPSMSQYTSQLPPLAHYSSLNFTHYFVADYQPHLSLLARRSYLPIFSAQKFLLAIVFSGVQNIACPFWFKPFFIPSCYLLALLALSHTQIFKCKLNLDLKRNEAKTNCGMHCTHFRN